MKQKAVAPISVCLAVFLSGVALLLACQPATEPVPRFDNLILLMIDTLRADHLASYGYERRTSPYLDRLAAEGIALDGYAASSWTRSSIATLLTGLHAQRHQTISRADALPGDLLYLPELLQERGFVTAAFVGNRNVGKKLGFARGYDAFFERRVSAKIDGAEVTERTLTLRKMLKAPYFLQVHYVDPHDPYVPERAWGQEDSKEHAPYVQPRRLRREPGESPEEAFPEAQLQQMVDQYDGEILELDAQIEILLKGFNEAGLLENTLVVVTSDHGEEFGEHGGLTHGRTLYEEVIRVPLILWAKKGLPGHETRHRFHQVDFLPTILEALDQKAPELAEREIDGETRWQLLTSPEPAPAKEEPDFFHLDLDKRGSLALLQGERKLIHRNRKPHSLAFDLAADPGEQAPQEADQAQLETLLRHHNRLGILAAERQKELLDDETRQSLAALGYLELDTPQEELEERTVPRKLDREAGFGAL